MPVENIKIMEYKKELIRREQQLIEQERELKKWQEREKGPYITCRIQTIKGVIDFLKLEINNLKCRIEKL